MKLRLWPTDVTVAEHGEAAVLVGLRTFTVATPTGRARIQYVLYQVRGGIDVGGVVLPALHAQFEPWSYEACTDDQFAWLHAHKDAVRSALLRHLEAVRLLPPGPRPAS